MFATWPEEAMLFLKLRDSDFDKFFEDGTKLKIPSEINPHLSLQFKYAISNPQIFDTL